MDERARERSLARAYELRSVSKQDFVESFCKNLATKVGLLHSQGGHNYASSPHNIYVDGTLVDFEYCHLPDIPAIDPALQTEAAAWQQKEILGWIDTLATLQAIPGVQKTISQWEVMRLFLDVYARQIGEDKCIEFVSFLRDRIHSK